MVHRQLLLAIAAESVAGPAAVVAAAGGAGDSPLVAVADADVEQLSAQCELCNERKAAAKEAQEASDAVYLSVYLRATGPMLTDAVVCDASGDKFFTVLLPALDLEHRVYFDRCGLVAAMSPGGGGGVKQVVARRATPQEILAGGGGGAGAALLADAAPRAAPAEPLPTAAAATAEAEEEEEDDDEAGDDVAAAAGGAAVAGDLLSKRKLRNIVKWARRHPAEAEAHLGLAVEPAGAAGSKDAELEAVRQIVSARGAAFFADALKAADAAAAASRPVAPLASPGGLQAAAPAAAGPGVPTAAMARRGVIPQVAPGALNRLFPAGATQLHIQPMTRFRVQLVAVADRVPIDSDVQLVELLPMGGSASRSS